MNKKQFALQCAQGTMGNESKFKMAAAVFLFVGFVVFYRLSKFTFLYLLINLRGISTSIAG